MENQNTPAPSSEFDFDVWLADGERVTHTVNLYGRMGLIGEIERLEKQRTPVPEVQEGDASLSGEDNPNKDIDAQIEQLYTLLDASKIAFQVTGRNSDEINTIRETVLKDCSDTIDEAAAKGREEGRKIAKRGGVTDPKEINALVRLSGTEWSQKIINHEINLRIVAESAMIITPSGPLQPISLSQVRAMHKKLGDQQIGLLVDAAYQAKDEMPEINVPK